MELCTISLRLSKSWFLPNNLSCCRSLNYFCPRQCRMVESFRTWAASWGADIPLGPCEYPDLAATNLKEQASKS